MGVASRVKRARPRLRNSIAFKKRSAPGSARGRAFISSWALGCFECLFRHRRIALSNKSSTEVRNTRAHRRARARCNAIRREKTLIGRCDYSHAPPRRRGIAAQRLFLALFIFFLPFPEIHSRHYTRITEIATRSQTRDCFASVYRNCKHSSEGFSATNGECRPALLVRN